MTRCGIFLGGSENELWCNYWSLLFGVGGKAIFKSASWSCLSHLARGTSSVCFNHILLENSYWTANGLSPVRTERRQTVAPQQNHPPSRSKASVLISSINKAKLWLEVVLQLISFKTACFLFWPNRKWASLCFLPSSLLPVIGIFWRGTFISHGVSGPNLIHLHDKLH